MTGQTRCIGRTLVISTCIFLLLFPPASFDPLQNSSNSLVNDIREVSDSNNSDKSEFSPRKSVFREEIDRKKLTIISILLLCCGVLALILYFVNNHQDFQELDVFYRGYMGRRLLVQEKRLVLKNPRKVCEIQLKERDTQCQHSLLEQPLEFQEMIKVDESEESSTSPSFPNKVKYIEDEDPEWRELNYVVPICPPPATFCSFYKQYYFGMFGDSTEEVALRRKNILLQFRKWKKKKRKVFNIIVTERSRREMAVEEEEKNKKRQKPSS